MTGRDDRSNCGRRLRVVRRPVMTDRIEMRRSTDGELVGFVAPFGYLLVPTTVFGLPLSEPCDDSDAEQIVRERAMMILADRWLLTLQGRDEPISVEIVKASPSSVKNVDFGYEGDAGEQFTLPTPVGDRLRPS